VPGRRTDLEAVPLQRPYLGTVAPQIVTPHDSTGANLIVQVKQGKVKRVLPLENDAINECWISDKDRFSYEALDSADRLTQPMLKQGGEWKEVDWQTALEYVAHGLKNIKHEHGADALAAYATGHNTVEELVLLKKLMSGVGSDNIDFRLRQRDFALDGEVAPWLGMPIAEISNLQRAFVIGSFLRKDHPLFATRLRAAVKAGGKLSTLNATNDDNLINTASKLIAAPSDWLAALSGVVAAVAKAKGVAAPAGFDTVTPSDSANAIAASLLGGENKAVFLGNAAVQHPQASALHAAAQWIAEATGAKLGYLTEAANTVGGYLVGATAKKAAPAFSVPKKAYVLLNAEPELDAANPQAAAAALKAAEMVVVMSAFKHGHDYADVLLPVAPFAETSGTFVNAEGRAQSFNGTVKPLGEARPAWKVLRVLGNILGLSGFDYETSEAIRDEALRQGRDRPVRETEQCVESHADRCCLRRRRAAGTHLGCADLLCRRTGAPFRPAAGNRGCCRAESAYLRCAGAADRRQGWRPAASGAGLRLRCAGGARRCGAACQRGARICRPRIDQHPGRYVRSDFRCQSRGG
jgi:NADH-quinone oxidoreductase subunit G